MVDGRPAPRGVPVVACTRAPRRRPRVGGNQSRHPRRHLRRRLPAHARAARDGGRHRTCLRLVGPLAPRGLERAQHRGAAHVQGACEHICIRVRGIRGGGRGRHGTDRDVVGGVTCSPHGDGHAGRPTGRRRGVGGRANRLPFGRGEGQVAPGERAQGHPSRGEPARPLSGERQGRDGGGDACRPRRDEAPQHQRGALRALPERPALAGHVRRAGSVRDRRGERRGSRVQHESVARQQVPRVLDGAHLADGGAGPQPPERDHLVSRKRSRLRPGARRRGSVDPIRRPGSAAALRACGVPHELGGRRTYRHRHRVPDVRHHRRDHRVRQFRPG